MYTAALVVEDEEGVQHLLRRVLRKHCEVVDCESDGLNAIARLQSGAYELVLLDLILPKANGFQVASAIEKLPRRPKVVVVSSVAREFDDRFPEGTVVLQKPFAISRLEALLG